MKHEETIFAEALALASEGERQVFLDEACADDANLRAKVEKLLRAQDEAGSFLQRPPTEIFEVAEAITHSLQYDVDTQDTSQLHVRCPHCRSPLQLEPNSELLSIHCTVCESDFSLLSDQVDSQAISKMSQLAHFRLQERVGMGGFGAVWKAHDTKLDRIVAVKIPRKGQFDQEQEKAFIREAQNAAQLSHPGIVPVYEVGREDETLYIVSDFVHGITMAEWLEGGQPTTHEAAQLAIKIATALHHAHERNIVHLDLKPGNIMLDEQLEPHLMDFGLARREVNDVTVSLNGCILGTPAFMSPEQAEGKGNQADRRSDIYSLGVMLFQLLTGELPFRGNLRMLLHQVIHDEPPSPRALNSNITRDLETITLKCLEKDPGKRYATSQEVAEDLQRCLEDKPIIARPVGVAERVWRLARRNPVASTLTAATAISLLAGIIISNYFAISASRSEEKALAEASRALKAEELALERESEAIKQLGLAQISQANAAYLDEDAQRAKKYLSLCPKEVRDTNWDYLNKYCDNAIYRLDISGIYGLQPDPITPGNFYVYQASGDLRCIEGKTGQTIRHTTTKSYGCRLAVSPNGTKLALFNRFKRTQEKNHIVVFAANSLQEIARWSDPDFQTGEKIFFTHDAKFLVIGNRKQSLAIKVATGQRQILENFFAICSHPLSNFIYGKRDGTLVEMDPASQKITKRFSSKLGEVFFAEVSTDGKRLISSSNEGRVLVYEVKTGKLIKSIKAYKEYAQKAVLGNQNRGNLATIGRDGRNCIVRCWNLGQITRAPQKTILVHSGANDIQMAWDERSGILLSGKKNLAAYQTPSYAAARLSPGGRQVRFLSDTLIGFKKNFEDGRNGLVLLDIPSRKTKRHIPDYSHVVRSRTRETNWGAWLVHSTNNRTRQMLDLQQEDALAPGTPLTCIDLAAVAPEKKYFVSGVPRNVFVQRQSLEGQWEVIFGENDPNAKIQIPEKARSPFTRAFFPAAEKPLLLMAFLTQQTSEEFRVYQLYDLETKELLLNKQVSAAASCLKMNSTGKLLVAGVPDGTLRGIDSLTLEEKFVFRAHDREITALAIRPDNGLIATGDAYGLIRLWQCLEGRPARLVRELYSNRGKVESLDFSPSGDQLACISHWNVMHYDLKGLELEPTKQFLAKSQSPTPKLIQSFLPAKQSLVQPKPKVETPTSQVESQVSGPLPVTILNSPDWEWTVPEDLATHANSPTLSADGLMLVYSTRHGSTGTRDLCISTRSTLDQPFPPAANLSPNVNSMNFEEHPCLLGSGLRIVYTRQEEERKPEFWMSSRSSLDEPFGKGKKLVTPGIGYAKGPHMTDDELTLIFQSSRSGGLGGYDLWMSTRTSKDQPFGQPKNLGPQVNSPQRDTGATLTQDGLTLLFSSDRDGAHRLWMSSRRSPKHPFGKAVPVDLPWPRDSIAMSPCLSGDGKILIFNSKVNNLSISYRVPKVKAKP